MQTKRQPPARNQNAGNFRERFGNIHIRQSNSGNYPIETLIFEGQALASSMQIRSIRKSHPGDRETAFVDIKTCDLVRSSNAPRCQVQARSATQVEHSHKPPKPQPDSTQADRALYLVEVRSAYDAGLPDGSVDTIFCIALIYHLDIARVLREMPRTSAKDGKLSRRSPFVFPWLTAVSATCCQAATMFQNMNIQ